MHDAPKRILIVEDNELSCRLLSDVLEVHGYVVATTALGKEAVELARRDLPDLILLDIQLPDIPGTEVARQLKADSLTRAIPIIAVTAFAMRGDRRRILDSGCDSYFSKPLRSDDLLKEVGRFVEEQSPQSE